MSKEATKPAAINEDRFMNDPAGFLYDLLLERKARNRSYSIRAFARDLGLSPAFVSQLMSGKRNASLEQKLKLASHLGIEFSNIKVQTASAHPKKSLQIIKQTLEHDKILNHWYHFGIMCLAQMKQLTLEDAETAKRLGISVFEAKTAIRRLIEFGYLAREGKLIIRTTTPFLLDTKKSSHALRQFHRVRLLAAEQELDFFEQTRIDQRYFQTMFIPSSKEKVKMAKRMVADFQQRLISFLMENEPDEVFQMSFQLFSAEKPVEKKSARGPKQ